jgi:membrane protease YdiL (CAAX protease family)
MSGTIPSVGPNQTAPPEQKLIAPLWHTIVLVLLILGLSANSYFQAQRPTSGGGVSGELRLTGYLETLIVAWVLVAYVSWPMRRRGITIRKAINARWSSARAVWRDLGIALLVLAGYYVVGLAGAVVLQGHEAKASQTFAQRAPHSALELCVWIALAISAGFCEEFVFRGYLQEQCRRLTASTVAAVVIQALIFGAAHGWEGWAPMLTIFPIALFFGATVAWRKSLAPTMIAHGAADTIGTVGAFLEHVMRRI